MTREKRIILSVFVVALLAMGITHCSAGCPFGPAASGMAVFGMADCPGNTPYDVDAAQRSAVTQIEKINQSTAKLMTPIPCPEGFTCAPVVPSDTTLIPSAWTHFGPGTTTTSNSGGNVSFLRNHAPISLQTKFRVQSTGKTVIS